MAINKIPINIDLKNKKFNNYVAQQNDNMLLDINIIENGVAKDLSKETLIVNYVNANNTIAVISGENVIVNGNNVKISCPNDCSRSNGQAKFSLVIKGADGQVSTYPIDITIEKGVIDGQAQSENIATIIEDLNNASLEATQKKNELEDVIKTADTATYATKGEINGVKSDLEDKANYNELKKVYDRVDAIITTPAEGVSSQEIIDAREGKTTLRENISSIKSDLEDYKINNANINSLSETNNVISLPPNSINNVTLHSFLLSGTSNGATVSKILTCGKNLFDGILEPGSINDTTGANLVDNTRVRSKNYIPVPQNKKVSIKIYGLEKTIAYRLYDKNKTLVGKGTFFTSQALTIPQNCCYLRLVVVACTDTSVMIQVEINDVSTIFEYYKETALSFNEVTLRANGDIKDTLSSDGTHIKRIDDNGTILNEPIVTRVDFDGGLLSFKKGNMITNDLVECNIETYIDNNLNQFIDGNKIYNYSLSVQDGFLAFNYEEV